MPNMDQNMRNNSKYLRVLIMVEDLLQNKQYSLQELMLQCWFWPPKLLLEIMPKLEICVIPTPIC